MARKQRKFQHKLLQQNRVNLRFLHICVLDKFEFHMWSNFRILHIGHVSTNLDQFHISPYILHRLTDIQLPDTQLSDTQVPDIQVPGHPGPRTPRSFGHPGPRTSRSPDIQVFWTSRSFGLPGPRTSRSPDIQVFWTSRSFGRPGLSDDP